MPVRLYQNSGRLVVSPIEASDLVDQAPLYADSIEVLRIHYRGKLHELKEQLNKLNIEEHPRQIAMLARQVLSVNAILKELVK